MAGGRGWTRNPTTFVRRGESAVRTPCFYWTVLVLLLLSTAAAWAAPVPAGAGREKRVALVVGNSRYAHAPLLPNPEHDARAIAAKLSGLGFAVDLRIDVSKNDLDQALRRFGRRLQQADVALFYYAGHGMQVDGLNYLIPVEANPRQKRDLYYETVELTHVLQEMEGAAKVRLVFLDACRDNPLVENLAASLRKTRSGSVGRGLAPVDAAIGTLISYATKDGHVAADGEGKNSPYAAALLEHLADSGLEIGLMLRSVRKDVIARTNGAQTPWEYGSLLGRFYFAPPQETDQAPAADAAQHGQGELLLWRSVMDSQDVVLYDEYLKRYPQGQFAGVAQRKKESVRWKNASQQDTSAAYRAYLDAYPQGRYAGTARKKLAALAIPAEPPPQPAKPPPPQRAGGSAYYFDVAQVASYDVLNIRRLPRASSPKVGEIPYNGRCVVDLRETAKYAGNTWRRIEYGPYEGWVNSRFLTAGNNCP